MPFTSSHIHPTTLARLSCLVRYKHAVECIKWEKDDKGEEWVLSFQTTKRWDWKAVQGREDSYISHEGWKRRRAEREKWSEIRIINIGWCWKLPRKFVIFLLRRSLWRCVFVVVDAAGPKDSYIRRGYRVCATQNDKIFAIYFPLLCWAISDHKKQEKWTANECNEVNEDEKSHRFFFTLLMTVSLITFLFVWFFFCVLLQLSLLITNKVVSCCNSSGTSSKKVVHDGKRAARKRKRMNENWKVMSVTVKWKMKGNVLFVLFLRCTIAETFFSYFIHAPAKRREEFR